ncbi:1-phosphofructokinase [Vallitalea pronyensis]|uniref:Tagatose-6-phosphate kinase n=1 Tax=Vallitalea pronyensis TaxID=1348613 RepID=A0A8J8SIM2_9FIRM|nr:1-phosphofructokinase [Vallitalea pronyensis]QUI24658.1 1-phosphofructokinase [Vallitalea pronyensis]
MIITVTLSPTIDKTIFVDGLKMDAINDMKGTREDAGGKGINVSKMVKKLQGDTLAIGLIGGEVGHIIKKKLDDDNIPCDFIQVDQPSRYNIKIVDRQRKTFTDINEGGGYISPEKIAELEAKIFQQASEGDLLILSGRVPDNVDKTIYRKWIDKANRKGIKVILDADHEPLKEAVQAGPYMIKPNIHELERLLNTTFKSLQDITNRLSELFIYGIQVIVLSLGSQGAYLFTAHEAYYTPGLSVHVKSTVGAGDSMVGAMAFCIAKGMQLKDAFHYAVATSTATVQKEGTLMADLDTIESIKDKLEIKNIKL